MTDVNKKAKLANMIGIEVKLTDVNTDDSIVLQTGRGNSVYTKFEHIGFWHSDPLKQSRTHRDRKNAFAKLILKTDVHSTRGLFLEIAGGKSGRTYVPIEELTHICIAQPRKDNKHPW